MSLAERMIVVATLHERASQELAQLELEEKRLIEKSVKVLEQVVLKLQLEANSSSSGKLQNLIDHISTQFNTLTKASTRQAMENFKDAKV